MQRRTFGQFTLASALAPLALDVGAQPAKYPAKPIKFVVPFAAGGGGDTVARMLAQRLSERGNIQVVVENKVGAGGNIGSDFVLKSPPDGYTLLNMSSTYPIQAAVGPLPFDPIRDMQPIMMVSRDPVVLIVNNNSKLRTARDLIAEGKRTPDKLTHGSAGVGSIAHLGMEELAYLMGVKLVHIPYKGSSQAMSDLMGGSLDLMLTSATYAANFIKSGRVRALGIAGAQRSAGLPDVPTFEEQGTAGYNVVDWKAIAGPRGMPPEVVAYLNTELNAVLTHRGVTEKFSAEGTTPVGGTPEQMMQIVREDITRWKRVVEAGNIKVQ